MAAKKQTYEQAMKRLEERRNIGGDDARARRCFV